ncbi:GSCFA domain-containing protein [Hymenobacter busanensis]|uniref:GSCFA domain-containing protein n=1 Tax=Hymenobacter busanensis TaxID=2607656 RepID=UPI001F418FCE|nr:GSCFA domain-containing protein [Hymenobacter busanensis]
MGARVFTIGSCFSEVIGGRLAAHKVATQVNPFGTVFNPLAAAKLLRAAAGEDVDWQQHVVEARGRWQSYDLHATFGADSPVELVQHIEQTVQAAADFLRTADVVLWTLGTAFSYRLRDTGELVNNLHKLPAERFEKELLSAEEIVTAVAETHALLRRLNPNIRLVLTVSPVRHLRDTLPLNAVSKSVLRVACHYLSELLPATSYFPAYELLLDDLRDYRFYGADMLHPSEVAEDYVWEKFMGAYFDEAFRGFVYEWDAIQRSLAHRPLHEGAPEHRHFLEQTEARLQRLANVVNVRQELRELHKRIVALPPPKPAPAVDEDDDEERIDIGEGSAPAPARRLEPVVTPVVEAEALEEEREQEAEAVEAEEARIDEDHDYFSMVEGASLDETTDQEQAEGTAPKRRKRKRGGRKHKKGNRNAAEGAASEAGEAETVAAVPVDAVPVDVISVELAPVEPVESPAASDGAHEQAATSKSSRSRRGRRGKHAPEAAKTPEALSAEAAAPLAEPSAAVPQQETASEATPEMPGAPSESAEAAPAKSARTSNRKPARKPVPARPRPIRQATAGLTATPSVAEPAPAPETPAAGEPTGAADAAGTPAPRRRPAPRRKAAVSAAAEAAASVLAPTPPVPAPAVETPATPEPARRPARAPRRKPDTPAADAAPASTAPKRPTRAPRRKPGASEAS